MKICYGCGQLLAEEVLLCPSCGNQVGKGRTRVDDYEIEEILHEGHSSILCKARRQGEQQHVMIRIFTPNSGVDEQVAARLKRELEQLKRLPETHFVQHLDIRRSWDGIWYRVSEWIDAENWGDLLRSKAFEDLGIVLELFGQVVASLEKLHESGYLVPHLTLNDIIVIKKKEGGFQVKLDYKLSRFLNPKLDRPPPMLKHLLSCHPDILNGLPLDTRSDIWSLGKIFVEILSGEFEIKDITGKLEELQIPQTLKLLLRTMLAADPDLRPRSAGEVQAILRSIPREEILQAPKKPIQAPRGVPSPWSWMTWLVLLIVMASGLGFVAYWFLIQQGREVDLLEKHANNYAGSIAFVLVDYRLREGEKTLYRNRAEGTAFLVDSAGYLLTSRHVACPWLEDPQLQSMAQELKVRGGSPDLEYRMYLWFEGAKAFNRAAALLDTRDVTDLYYLGSAFQSHGFPSVRIEGVAKKPTATRQLIFSPLRDDFAVLRVQPVPENLRPLPLAAEMDPRKIPKLSKIITLGFPLGSRTQVEQVNVSVTRGNVRRSFEEAIHIDAALYGGNSGGPVIDERGMVIGIASGVATERAQGLLPTVVPLWNLAMALPIGKAASFVQELRKGQPKWKGVQDFLLDMRLERISRKAAEGRWAEAAQEAEKQRQQSSEPIITLAAAVLHWCAKDHHRAQQLLAEYVSMDPDGAIAKLLALVLEWFLDRIPITAYARELGSAGWGSPWEFLGHLYRILQGAVEESQALQSWDTSSERSWINWLIGMMRQKRGELEKAERLMQEAVLSAPADSWEAWLAQAGLESVQQSRLEKLLAEEPRSAYMNEVKKFRQRFLEARSTVQEKKKKMEELQAKAQEEQASLADKVKILVDQLALEPENGKLLEELAFLEAAQGHWDQALSHVRNFLGRPGRENARRLTMGMLEGLCLHLQGRTQEAVEVLEAFLARTAEPWHRAIAECVLGKRSKTTLLPEAAQSPEKLLTLHLVMGAWAEGASDRKTAEEQYREVMASFLDDWVQFEFARERLKALRRSK
ncbi:MAG: trypsin-like peptidase domain-containing protein [bacterium]